MNVGEKMLTKFPISAISGENGEFLVIDHFGNMERYFCAGNRVVLIRGDGVDGEHQVPEGQFLVEKVADDAKLLPDE